METTVTRQALEAAAALAMGAAAGLFYDILRVIRRRAPLSFVTAVCDFVFCAVICAALFLLGLTIGGGRARALLGALSALGGALYFLTLSRPMLYILQGLADLAGLPAAIFIKFAKKIVNLIKKLFNFALGWYIFKERNVMTGDLRPMKRAGLIPKILVFAMIAFLSWLLIGLRGEINRANNHRDELRAEAAKLELENDEMKRRLDRSGDDEIIAEIARDNLGLLMPGEQVYYD
jgi:cell division protein FtsB